jgi:hypothetical protein
LTNISHTGCDAQLIGLLYRVRPHVVFKPEVGRESACYVGRVAGDVSVAITLKLLL